LTRSKASAAADERAVVDVMLLRPRPSTHIARSRWMAARGMLFAGFAALCFASLLLKLASQIAIAG
jgi:hypothetical protein